MRSWVQGAQQSWSKMYQWKWYGVRICSTVRTQPGTLVSFQGMLLSFVYSISGYSGTPTFPISRNSGLQHFLIFWFYVMTLVSYLDLSLVTLSAVVSTSLSPDPQFPLALPDCSCLCTQIPFSVPSTNLFHSLVISTCILYLNNQN